MKKIHILIIIGFLCFSIALIICCFIQSVLVRNATLAVMTILQFAVLLHFITFTLKNIRWNKEIISDFALRNKISEETIKKYPSLPNTLLLKLRDNVQPLLEIIQAVTDMMENPDKFSQTVTYAKVIRKYILKIKEMFDLDSHYLAISDTDLETEVVNTVSTQQDESLILTNDNQTFPELDSYKDMSICIFGSQKEADFLLRYSIMSEGFFCINSDSTEDVLTAIENGRINMLIIDASINADNAFTLCRQIRTNYNILEFPILMVIDIFTDCIVKTAYISGVNDFIVRPYDSTELVARCYSLFLKQATLKTHINNS